MIVLPSGSEIIAFLTTPGTVDRSCGQPPLRELGDVGFKVVHQQRQQGCASAVGVCET